MPTGNLEGWWSCDGNANDGSGNSNHGTVSGATLTTDRFGEASKAYNFDGANDYIMINGLPINYSSYTYSAWVKSDLLIQPSGTGIVVQTGKKTSASLIAGSFGISANDTCFWGRHRKDNSDLIVVKSIDCINTSWNLITWTWDGDNLAFYINGYLNGTYEESTNDVFYDELIIGGLKYLSSVDYFFDGKIDDIGVWSRALTTKEVQDLYCNSTHLPCVEGITKYGEAKEFSNDFVNKNGKLSPEAALDKFGNQ